jgi:VWFA-related protein
MCSKNRLTVALAAVVLIFTSMLAARAADGNEHTIVVTAHPHSEQMRKEAMKLRADDFAVREEKVAQKILSVKSAAEAPPIIAVLVQDDLVAAVNNELNGLRQFIRGLPEGSRVMTGYITAGSLRVTQDFTTDRARAADSLRILRGTADAAPFNPYVELLEALRKFDTQPAGRRLVLMVSDGLDTSRGLEAASALQSIDLERAIREAQRRSISVFSFYAPSVGLTNFSRLEANYGQSSLNRLGDETGGEAFYSGFLLVTFDPYIKEFNDLLGMQWVITYRSETPGTSFRRLEVTTEANVHLHYQQGYSLKK